MSPLSKNVQMLEAATWVADDFSVRMESKLGSGRSYTLRTACEHLDDYGIRSVVFRGRSALTTVPFGALMDAGVVDRTRPPSALVDAASALSQRLSASRTVVAIDDADLLDEASARTIALAVESTGAALLMTTLPKPHPSPAVSILSTSAHQEVVLGIPAMQFDQVNALIAQDLDGPIDPSVVAKVLRLSGGLPGAVKAVLGVARHIGTVKKQRGVWVAPGDLWHPSLSSLAKRHLIDVSPEELALLRHVSQTGTLDNASDDAMRTLGTLRARDLLRPASGWAPVQYVVHPRLVAEHLMSTAPGLSGPARRLDGTTHETTPSALDALARVSVPSFVERMVTNTTTAVSRGESELASAPSIRHGIDLLLAHNLQSVRPETVQRIVDATRPQFQSNGTTVRFAVLATILAGLSGDPTFHDGSFTTAFPATQPTSEALAAARIHVDLVRGISNGAATDRALPLGNQDAAIPTIAAVKAEGLVAAGKTTEAQLLIQRTRDNYGEVRRQFEVMAGLAELLDGHVDAAIDHATRHLARVVTECHESGFYGHSYVAGLALVLAGRFDDFDKVAEISLSLPDTPTLEQHFRAGLLSLAATVAMFRGRNAYARQLIAQVRASAEGNGPFPGMLAGEALTLLHTSCTSEEDANAVWKASIDQAEAGFTAAAALQGLIAAENSPDPAAMEQLRHQCGEPTAPLVTQWLAYGEALASQDLTRLAECRVVWQEMGCTLLAVRCQVAEAGVAYRTDQAPLAWKLASQAWSDSAVLGQERSGMFTRLVSTVNLSDRELDVVRLIGTGMNASGVAHALTISVRTVESHIQSAYRKTGAKSRDELVAASTTWLAAQSL